MPLGRFVLLAASPMIKLMCSMISAKTASGTVPFAPASMPTGALSRFELAVSVLELLFQG
ncbi:hypothetical protein DMX10_18135 [Pseudomonas sp. 57B-090624]|nr:hypothetical protein DMX10_18135 [Pseudomonas sp. 57B-090624]